MALNAKQVFVGLCLVGVANFAHAEFSAFDEYSEQDYFTLKEVKVDEIKTDPLNQEVAENIYFKQIRPSGLPDQNGNVNPIEQAKKVIAIGRDLVALGEDIYRLVVKGKPSNTTKYAPISVVPRMNNEPVDIMHTENWQAPVKRTFQVKYVNLYGMDVVIFRYAVIFAYGGTYEGKGAYLTAVQVIPESVSTLFGYDFTATMKLGGIQNNGTRDNPIAGATLLLEHTVNTVVKAHTQVATFFVTGKGGFKAY